MINVPSRSELRTLIEKQRNPCISLFAPTDRHGTEMEEDQLRLRNQIREVEHRLRAADFHATQVEDLLEPIQALLEDEAFWLHQGDGLAILRSPEVFRYYRLPAHMKEQIIVTDHFHLKPVFPFLANGERFYILALSQNKITLLEGTQYTIRQIELPEGVPESLAETLQYDEPENELQYHSSAAEGHMGKHGRYPAIFHGRGVGTDDTKENILRYFHQVNHGLHSLLRDVKVPLVLAGVEFLLPIYREANTYDYLYERAVLGNPDKLKAETLHERGWAVVEPYFEKPQQEAFARYREYVDTERTSNTVSEIVPAAYYGRVESLFVAAEQEQWGTFDPATSTVHVHEEAEPGDSDLLNIAATQTFLHRGGVYVVEQARVPDTTPAAAVFRY